MPGFYTTDDGSQISEAAARLLGMTRDQGLDDVNAPSEPDDNGNGNGEEGDCEQRLEALERAVAILAQEYQGANGGEESNEESNGEVEEDNYEDPGQQLASRMVQSDQRHFTTGSRDAVPDISDINEKNKAFYQQSAQSVSAGGSPSTTPAPGSSTTATASNFQPNNTGSINVAKITSKAPKTPDMMGKTGNWGTSDQMTRFWTQQRLNTNDTIRRISQVNAKHYGR